MRTIVHLMGMNSTKFGGVEKFMLSLIDSLPNDKFYLVYNKEPLSEFYLQELRRRNVDVLIYKTGGMGLDESLKFVRFLTQLKIDIAHFHFDVNIKIVYLLKMMCSNIKIYLTIHSEIYNTKTNLKLFKYIYCYFRWHFLSYCVDCFLCVSKHVKEQLCGIYNVKKRSLIVYLGVENQEKEVNLDIVKKKKIVTTIGFDNPIKGIDIFIKSLAYIGCQNYEAWIIGLDEESKYTKSLKILSKELGVYEKIKWIGIVDNASSYLKYSDIFCQTSRSEALSLAACEALMSGCVVIGSNIGGLPEVAQLTFEMGNFEMLAGLVNNLLSNENYCNLLKGEAIKKYENKFQLKKGVEAYKNLYLGK